MVRRSRFFLVGEKETIKESSQDEMEQMTDQREEIENEGRRYWGSALKGTQCTLL